jgi:hypothetical protein
MKPFTTLAIVVFELIALVHLFRIIWGFEVVVSGMEVPQWVSVPGLIISLGFALSSTLRFLGIAKV